MNVKIPEVQTCCCCISLRTGAKIFGFISIIGCICLIGLSAWELTFYAKYAPDGFEEAITILPFDIVFQIIQIVTSIFLLMGVYQERANYIPPWLVTTIVVVVLEIIFLPSFMGRIIGIEHKFLQIDWIIFTLFMLFDDLYGLLVVYSYYRTLVPQRVDLV